MMRPAAKTNDVLLPVFMEYRLDRDRNVSLWGQYGDAIKKRLQVNVLPLTSIIYLFSGAAIHFLISP